MANKIEVYVCTKCEKPILKPEEGFVVHGNIYVADTQTKGGLIGNNFPIENGIRSTQNISDMVEESAYCTPCFLGALNIKASVIR